MRPRPDWILIGLVVTLVACLGLMTWAISQCEKPEQCAASAAVGVAVGAALASGGRR